MGRKTWDSLRAPAAGSPEHRRHAATRSSRRRAPTSRIRSTRRWRSRACRRRSSASAAASSTAPRCRSADVLYLTEIDRDFDGDARFPAFDRTRVCAGRSPAKQVRGARKAFALRVRHVRRVSTRSRCECRARGGSRCAPRSGASSTVVRWRSAASQSNRRSRISPRTGSRRGIRPEVDELERIVRDVEELRAKALPMDVLPLRGAHHERAALRRARGRARAARGESCSRARCTATSRQSRRLATQQRQQRAAFAMRCAAPASPSASRTVGTMSIASTKRASRRPRVTSARASGSTTISGTRTTSS